MLKLCCPQLLIATPIKYIPRAQMINGISATANMMSSLGFLSSFFQVSFRFCLLVGKFRQFDSQIG